MEHKAYISSSTPIQTIRWSLRQDTYNLFPNGEELDKEEGTRRTIVNLSFEGGYSHLSISLNSLRQIMAEIEVEIENLNAELRDSVAYPEQYEEAC